MEQLGCINLFFSTVNFVNSKYKSWISAEILFSKLRYTVSIKYTSDFKDLVYKENVKYLISNFYMTICENDKILYVLSYITYAMKIISLLSF